jgi:hypothetical protein
LLARHDGLPVLTCGSVFKSFKFLKGGFMEGLRPEDLHDAHLKKVQLCRLTIETAHGMALLAAREAKCLGQCQVDPVEDFCQLELP